MVRTVCGKGTSLALDLVHWLRARTGHVCQIYAPLQASTCLLLSPNMRVPDIVQVTTHVRTVQPHGFNNGSRPGDSLKLSNNECTFISSYLIYAMLFCLNPPEVLAPPRERKKRAQTATIAPMKKSFWPQDRPSSMIEEPGMAGMGILLPWLVAGVVATSTAPAVWSAVTSSSVPSSPAVPYKS